MTESARRKAADKSQRVFKGGFHRVRHGNRLGFVEKEPEPPERLPRKRPLRVARMLALAHKMQSQLDRGDVASRAELADSCGFSRARISQLLDLTLLAPDIQEAILFAEVESGYDIINEHALREVVRAWDWEEQRRRWAEVCLELESCTSAAHSLSAPD